MRLGRFRAPDTALLIFCIIVLAAILTWIVPPGAYDRTQMAVPGVGTRSVLVPGTFRTIERPGRDVLGALAHSAGQSREEILELLGGFEIEMMEEEETDDAPDVRNPKHWQLFHVVARKS